METWTPFELNDGGMKLSSHPNESLDCCVRALALACNMPYDEAHMRLKEFGRKDRHRTKRFFKFMLQIKDEYNSELIVPMKRISLFKFLKEYTTGTYIVGTGGHVFCVKDGVVKDTYLLGKKKMVRYFYKFGGKVSLTHSV